MIFLITLAGAPTAITLSGIFLLTKLKAPIIEFLPMVTPVIIPPLLLPGSSFFQGRGLLFIIYKTILLRYFWLTSAIYP